MNAEMDSPSSSDWNPEQPPVEHRGDVDGQVGRSRGHAMGLVGGDADDDASV